MEALGSDMYKCSNKIIKFVSGRNRFVILNSVLAASKIKMKIYLHGYPYH